MKNTIIVEIPQANGCPLTTGTLGFDLENPVAIFHHARLTVSILGFGEKESE